MKIERINENQIRCTLTSFDLSVRGLNLGELAYGSEKAKKLFHEMIQKASSEVGFDAEDTPLMVEAIPLSNESIMLIITKIEDPEELDTRFSKFSPFSEDEDRSFSSFAADLLEGSESLFELLENNADPAPALETNTGNSKKQTPKKQEDAVRLFTFDSLEDVCRAAKVAGQVFDGFNTLYKNSAKNRYYLLLKASESDSDSFKRVCNLLSEYGVSNKTDYAAEAYYQEHYEAIVKEHALKTLASL